MKTSVLLSACFALFFRLCSSPPPIEQQPLPDVVVASLRDEVREIIRPECGSCHTSGLPTAKAKAVAVFDLKEEEWAQRMTGEQLRSFAGRIGNDFPDSARAKAHSYIGALMTDKEEESSSH